MTMMGDYNGKQCMEKSIFLYFGIASLSKVHYYSYKTKITIQS
jgi:hypothetical protein